LLEIQTGKLEQNIESSDIRSFEKKTEKWREREKYMGFPFFFLFLEEKKSEKV
jgi:hypothetical protein